MIILSQDAAGATVQLASRLSMCGSACSDLLAAVRGQLHASGMKADAHGNLLQSFQNMDVTTGPAGTPRSTANTGEQAAL